MKRVFTTVREKVNGTTMCTDVEECLLNNVKFKNKSNSIIIYDIIQIKFYFKNYVFTCLCIDLDIGMNLGIDLVISSVEK